MNSFTIEILDDEGSKCTLYTVRKDGGSYSETEKFFEKRKTTLKHLGREFQELTNLLTQIIAEEDGALEAYFKDEREAHGLPPAKKFELANSLVSFLNFPLRLYCLRISNERLILFNGDEKTTWAGQSGKTRTTFTEAQDFAKRIKKALNEDEFSFEQHNEIIIY